MTAYKKNRSGYLPFIQKNKTASPYTDIQNRAKIDSSLKCSMGTERIHVNSLNLLSKEYGPNGEAVYEADNGDDRVRFIGEGWRVWFGTSGTYVDSTTAFNDPSQIIEVSFYGTGLNLLATAPSIASDTINMDISVDGGGATVVNVGDTNIILNARNTKPNVVHNLSNGLSLGWHTVKISGVVGTQDLLRVIGFEILNEASQITVQSGKAHGNGYEYEIENDQLIDYKLGFDNIIDANVGTKGGRVIVYVDPTDGTIKKRLTKTETTALFLGASNHINESPYRKINFREFGRNRADDFSTLASTSDRAFTLDDGTTTLVGDNVTIDSNGDLKPVTAPNFFTLTFVGCALDINVIQVTAGAGHDEMYIDDVYIGNLPATAQNQSVTLSICSGLTYGTHTFRFRRNNVTEFKTLSDFIIYQPKKPTLPENAIELSDYNVMADYVANTASGTNTIATGVLRKMSTREVTYTGTWNSLSLNSGYLSGFNLNNTVVSTTAEYTFFGTGFEMRYETAASADVTVEVDGSTNLSGFTTSVYGGTSTFTAATGNIGGDAVGASGLEVSGLILGLHTVKVTQNNTNTFFFSSFDIITPIYTPHTTFGSRSMKDSRNFDSAKDVNKIAKDVKTKVVFSNVSSVINHSKGISQILKLGTGINIIYTEEVYNEIPISSYISNYPETVEGVYYGDGSIYFDYRTRTSSGVDVNAGVNKAVFTGKLQKDELEE